MSESAALRPWPRQMRAETAAAYCGIAVDRLPPGYEIRPGEFRWLREDFDEAWENRDTSQKRRHVYFIQGDATRLVKIGVADDVSDRLRHLQAASPDKLVLLASVEGDQGLEFAFHRIFAAHRAHGEWFRPGPWLVEALAAIADGQPTDETLKKLGAEQ